MNDVQSHELPSSRCPHCKRPKAFSPDDVAAGKCPKWYAVRDEEAYRDCDNAARTPSEMT